MEDYANRDGLGLADLVRRKEVSPEELVDEAIARIEKHDEKLNAVVYRAFDQARRDASGILALLPIHHPEHCIPEPAAIH